VCGGATKASGDIVNGVAIPGQVAPPSQPSPSVTTPPPPGATVINFDDRTAPCLFVNTPPLTTEYSALGVLFSGPEVGGGGAVLNECANFTVTSYSSPNFLAFNKAAILQTGKVPAGPETITFANPASFVQLNAGHSSGGLVTLTCFSGTSPVGSNSLTATTALTTLAVQGQNMTRCVLTFDGDTLVVDDLAVQFAPSIPVPTLDAWMLIAFVGVVGVLGLSRLRN